MAVGRFLHKRLKVQSVPSTAFSNAADPVRGRGGLCVCGSGGVLRVNQNTQHGAGH